MDLGSSWWSHKKSSRKLLNIWIKGFPKASWANNFLQVSVFIKFSAFLILFWNFFCDCTKSFQKNQRGLVLRLFHRSRSRNIYIHINLRNGKLKSSTGLILWNQECLTIWWVVRLSLQSYPGITHKIICSLSGRRSNRFKQLPDGMAELVGRDY